MEHATSPLSVVNYMVTEMGFVHNKAQELVERHKPVVDKGIKFLAFPYNIAEEVVNAEESRVGGPLSEDYYADMDD